MILRNLYSGNHCDPLTLDCIVLAPAFFLTRLLRYVHYYLYSETVFYSSATMTDFLCSICSRKNGQISGCKQEDQEKLTLTPSGREKG